MRTVPMGSRCEASFRSLQASALLDAYIEVREATEALALPLSAEDQTIQSMSDASPIKWHRAHTTWFFETFVLAAYVPGYRLFDERYGYLFNSYYEAVGPRHPRPQRGLLTRPSVTEIARYRAYVDAAMAEVLQRPKVGRQDALSAIVRLGLNHEQQHQELILTDILHAFACNPLRPAYRPPDGPRLADFALSAPASASAGAVEWISFEGGLYDVGHSPQNEFAFDNECPRHQVVLRPFKLASRLVTNAEWQAFMADGGYRRPELWLSDGWAAVQAEGWQAPLYWEDVKDGEPQAMTLAGLLPVDPSAPVCHVSYYEADAFARWAGMRLATEAEWEVAASGVLCAGNFLDSGARRPLPVRQGDGRSLRQMFGDAWEWTASPYVAYPGYRPPSGAAGEYNGKFMCNQMVLRGGSCATPDGHVRASYRNFFYPHQRWQFSGVRLAEDA